MSLHLSWVILNQTLSPHWVVMIQGILVWVKYLELFTWRFIPLGLAAIFIFIVFLLN